MDILILFPFVLSCAFSDAITQHIPNRLILCGLIGALLARGSLVCRSPFLLVDGLAGFLLPWLVIGPLIGNTISSSCRAPDISSEAYTVRIPKLFPNTAKPRISSDTLITVTNVAGVMDGI